MCLCAHGRVIPPLCSRGSLQGCPEPWAGSSCGCGPAGRLASPAQPILGILVTSARVISREGAAVPGCPSSVCGTEPPKAPEAALALCTHWQSPQCHRASPTAPRAQSLLREGFSVLCMLQRGEARGWMRNALPLTQRDHILSAQCCLGR